MLINTSGAGGAGGLNFRVIGGTIAPANPKENTIWVNTDTTIGNYFIQTFSPISPNEGDIWLQESLSSSVSFNALTKDDSLYVHILSAQQYINSAWVSKETKIYQNGQWRSFTLNIFSNGVLYYPFTKRTSEGTVTISTANSLLTTTFGGWHYQSYIGATTVNPIDMSSFNTLKVTANRSNGAGNGMPFGVLTSDFKYGSSLAVQTSWNSAQYNTYSVDISGIDSGYIGYFYSSYGSGQNWYGTYNIQRLWLE